MRTSVLFGGGALLLSLLGVVSCSAANEGPGEALGEGDEQLGKHCKPTQEACGKPVCLVYRATDAGTFDGSYYAYNFASSKDATKHLKLLGGAYVEEQILAGTCGQQQMACIELYGPVCGTIDSATGSTTNTYSNTCVLRSAVIGAAGADSKAYGSWVKGECPVSQGLAWYETCGTPVCMVPETYESDPNYMAIPVCDSTQTSGASCSTEGATCRPATPNCGRLMRCMTEAPTICPISQREHKTEIKPLTAAEVDALYRDVKKLELNTYQYKQAPKGTPRRLGFIIEDLPPAAAAVATTSDKHRVDLYGYSSLAIAAIQAQAKEIESLRAELKELKKELRAHPLPSRR